MKILGGKNKKLKCDCGNLRYAGVELCPKCYFSKVKYYVYSGEFVYESGYDGCNIESGSDIEITKAISPEQALEKISHYDDTYGKNNEYSNNRWIPTYPKGHEKAKNQIGNTDDWINGLLLPLNTYEEAKAKMVQLEHTVNEQNK